MTLTADIAYGQIIGQRQRQEDRLAVVRDGEDGPARFLVLSDGMGGAVGGDIAAGVIVDTVVEALDGAAGGAGAAGSALRAAAVAANKALRARVRADPGLDGMGGTLVIVRLAGAGLLFFSMGDSPLRLVRAGQAIRLNADHSVGGMLDAQVARGEISAAAAAERRDRNSIVSVLTGGPIGGMRMDESADLTPLAAGDVLVLASDGLDTLAAEEIAAVAGQDRPAVELAEALLAAVEAADRPRQDNASVIVARFRPS